MISNSATGTDGNPVDPQTKISKKSYNPSDDVKKLWEKVLIDYVNAYNLQQRPFDEFDQMSLLQRMNQDQQTFAAFVGANFEPADKSWRWKGRKNTARNKIIGILAHVISGMLFPMVYAYNEENKEDELTARVMRILVENHLKKANYEMKFLFMMCSALVNPAVFASVEYIEACQKIKTKKDGKWVIEEAVDELLTGINLDLIPVDQLLLGDFYTFDIQKQPYIVRVRRIAYDQAKAIYGGKFTQDGEDLFNFVRPGEINTAGLGASRDYQTIFNIDFTNADANFVQEITVYYKSEDLQATFVGGIFFGNQEDVFNTNPFKKRRITTSKKGEYITAPVYPFAKTGFEPIDPNGRFAYYKSAAFKEYWDDASQNRMYQLAQDGTYLDVFKPMFLSGVASIDSSVMVPGATIGMPQGASATPYQLGPNLQAALQLMRVNQDDMSLSTQDALQSGVAEKGITATASIKAEQNAKVIMNVFSTMVADLVRQIGELTVDDILLYTTTGEIDASIPENLKVKYKTIRAREKEGGKDITNLIEFSDEMMFPNYTKEKAEEKEWELFTKNGGMDAKSYEYVVNPYKFARSQFNVYVDPQQIISRSLGTDQLRKERAFVMLTNPIVQPYVDMAAVVDKFILQEYTDGDPGEFKAKQQNENQLANAMFGGMPQPNQQIPSPMNPQIAPTTS